jgi:IgA Peptidase M64
MTSSNGTVIGTTKIVDNGSPTSYWNLVILGDGYQAGQLGQYAVDAQSMVDAIFATPPLDALRRVGNVYRVDVTSTDSGADDPTACGGTGASPRTFFDSRFCGAPDVRRLLVADAAGAMAVAGAQVPEWDMVLLLVNSTVYGGSGGPIATTSMAPDAKEIALHEMGHTAFQLADEYDYYRGCFSGETDRNIHPPVEPTADNVTLSSTRAAIKWRLLIRATTPVPTTVNSDCTSCDTQASPVPEGTVGAFEGAHYHHCKAYRPEYRCKMYELGRPFCAVCRRRILQVLPSEVPFVQELRPGVAADLIYAAGLIPQFTGSSGPNSYVATQSPKYGSVVPHHSTVRCFVRKGPIP